MKNKRKCYNCKKFFNINDMFEHGVIDIDKCSLFSYKYIYFCVDCEKDL